MDYKSQIDGWAKILGGKSKNISFIKKIQLSGSLSAPSSVSLRGIRTEGP
ncbi:hypothetical protein LptCag_2697 [Leptospirillum ferriphilum]|uniref:Uncharacterized protein n=1 Tax=Leptospirillum ferriphilum TaxID=178606 RepID=A0A094YHI3_9BACT|nr:hypothetical protein LptCag_2697 [Leptospirillum ferriphilum]